MSESGWLNASKTTSFFLLVLVESVEGVAETSVDVSAVREHHLEDIDKAFWEQWQEVVTVYLPYVDKTPILSEFSRT